MSGLMGGMMGAMLGEMILPEYQTPMIHIMFVIFVGMVCIVLYILQQETGFNRSSFIRGSTSEAVTTPINKIFHNPLLLVIVFLLFFYTYYHVYNELTRYNNVPIKNLPMSPLYDQ
ncbi:hypothetical protein [Aeribacillus alveayuensis]|uniref:Uncharacterized protein n=1 Tax=Aeribacillus alveayuensis TaxID=279215 RepID=A0ABT9VLT4_9BACI|nr:hypothetical protein [Bacillus alveayuensis]